MPFFESDAKRLERLLKERDRIQTKISNKETAKHNRELKAKLKELEQEEQLHRKQVRAERIARFKTSSANAGAKAKVLGGKLKSGTSRLKALRIRGSPLRTIKHKVFKR